MITTTPWELLWQCFWMDFAPLDGAAVVSLYSAGPVQPSVTCLQSYKKKKQKQNAKRSVAPWGWNASTAPSPQSHGNERTCFQSTALSLARARLRPPLCTITNVCTWKIRSSVWVFVNTICTVKTLAMKNKNTFQKDQKWNRINGSLHSPHALVSHSHTWLKRQQMSILSRQ